jgi:ABC-2 type transport system ATP-binding protein
LTQLLALSRVTKRFGDFTAVDDLSFAVQEGEVFGFLGGNGAGKTTTLRMVLDIIRPTSGTISVMGRPPGRENSGEIGFLPEERGLYRQMTALDTIVYFGRLKGMTAAAARDHGRELLKRFELGDNEKTSVDKLSKGMAQKVQLATALVNRPRLLILDEPFSGLDPVNQGLLEDEIVRASRAGATVIFSTHVMQHAERLCDRLLLLAKGRKRFEGTQDEARATLPARLQIVSRTSPAALPGVAEATAVGDVEAGWQAYDVRLDAGVDPGDVLLGCTEKGVPLRRFEPRRATLHDVFLHLVGTAPDAPAHDHAPARSEAA